MLKDKTITIISSNTLVGLGLKSILLDYFTVGTVYMVGSYNEYIAKENEMTSDLIFMPLHIYVLHEYFHGIRSKIIVMFEKNERSQVNQTSLTLFDVSLPQSKIVDNLQTIFNSKIRDKQMETNEELSVRETEVLKLVAIGLMSKQIADLLNISLHTVISHRKNVTRKLGINTVSGLTVYAMLNGMITSDDLTSVNSPRHDFQV